MSIIIENASVRFTADNDFKGSLRVMHLTFNLKLGALLSPFINIATSLNQLFSIGSMILERKL